MAQIFCSTRRLVEDFVLDVQQKFSTRRLVAEKQLPTRRLLEGVNIYQTSSSRKIALLDVQQNFYWMPSRTFTRRLVDQMIWAIACVYQFWSRENNGKHNMFVSQKLAHSQSQRPLSIDYSQQISITRPLILFNKLQKPP